MSNLQAREAVDNKDVCFLLIGVGINAEIVTEAVDGVATVAGAEEEHVGASVVAVGDDNVVAARQ